MRVPGERGGAAARLGALRCARSRPAAARLRRAGRRQTARTATSSAHRPIGLLHISTGPIRPRRLVQHSAPQHKTPPGLQGQRAHGRVAAMVAVALTIAGVDPSGGAGVAADLKTFHQHGVYGCAVVSLITVQNTTSVRRVEPLPAELVAEQLDAVLEDITPAAAKTGALGSAEIVRAVAQRMRDAARAAGGGSGARREARRGVARRRRARRADRRAASGRVLDHRECRRSGVVVRARRARRSRRARARPSACSASARARC